MAERADFETTVGGIPCGVVIDSYVVNRPCPYADSDWDYYGYTECDWHLVDRKGYKAGWLALKMTPEDSRRIALEIEKHVERERRYAYEP